MVRHGQKKSLEPKNASNSHTGSRAGRCILTLTLALSIIASACAKPPTSDSKLDSGVVKEFASAVTYSKCEKHNAKCLANKELASGYPKEIQDIMHGKQYIERHEGDLTNPYFTLKPLLGHLYQPHRLMEPLDPKKQHQAETYGYKAVVLKPGYEDLAQTVPRYVLFHEPIPTEFLKSEQYEDLWVDQNDPKCTDQAKTPNFGKAHRPSCKISTLVREYCAAARTKAFIIRVKEGIYYESGNMRLCNRMILTNYDNETVKITTLQDIKKGTPDGKWQQIDKSNNVWAVNWMSNVSVERWNGIISLVIDGNLISETPHWNTETIAPDKRNNYDTFETNAARPIYHWMTTKKYLPHLDAGYKNRIGGLAKNGLLPQFYGSVCKNLEPESVRNISLDMPSYEMLMGVGAPMHMKTKYNGLNSKTCHVVSGRENYAIDNRNVCHWSTPHPKLQGSNCEINYMYLSRYDLNQVIWKPEFCSKLPGNPDRCLILRLPPGKTPDHYQSIRAANTDATAAGVLQDWDFTHRNIRMSGIAFDNYTGSFVASHAWNNKPELTPLAPQDHYFFKMDGNEFNASSIPSFGAAEGIYLENSYFFGTGIIQFATGHPAATKIHVRNNFFHATDAKNIFINDGSANLNQLDGYANENCKKDKRIEYNTHYLTGIMNSGPMLGWCVENNYVYRGGGQEVIETGHLINSRFAQNWIEESSHSGFAPDASGIFHDLVIHNSQYENNQLIHLMGKGPDGKGAPGSCAKITGFPWHHYIYGRCQDFTFQNNLIAEADGGSCVQGFMFSFCKNLTIRNNTFAAPKDPTVGGMIGALYSNHISNLAVKGNLFVSHEQKDSAPMLQLWPGESLKDCLVKINNEKDRCLSLGVQTAKESCLYSVAQKEAELCTSNLDQKMAQVVANPNAHNYTFQNNYFDKCTAYANKVGLCPDGAGGFSDQVKPAFNNPDELDFRVTNAKQENLGDGFRHIGVHYLEERYSGTPAASKFSTGGSRWNIEMLFDEVKKSRGE